ncbi:MAG TPA: arginase family protein [Paludibacteraceae bacterium]|nr:arginase family protein [Paludibacteraceae bacterium]HQF51008.1 arginase family protein [Paludibacteraceae bacterium]
MKRNAILNFTDVYRYETFYQHRHFNWIDCQDIKGSDCFCDSDAAREIEQQIADFSPHGIHFIDSGNYHYISKFWTDKINYPFVLVVVDHHPDMQPSIFEGLLTCGSWVKDALDTNPMLKKVILIGADEKLSEAVSKQYGDRLKIYAESTLDHKETWNRFASAHVNLPIYISVDKDVLSTQDEHTNWDQGKLRLSELKKLLSIILNKHEIIGIDICGACPMTINQMVQQQDILIDDKVNQELLKVFHKHHVAA